MTYLDDNHTVFGEIVEGSELVEKLNDALVDDNSRPYQVSIFISYFRTLFMF